MLFLFAACGAQGDAWHYNWSTRVDRDGQPAGIYSSTPCPITETSTSYSLKTDEFPAGKTYTLGTLYFVDGARPDDFGNGLSQATAKKSINAALTVAGSGNKTILVRGAHDAFSGVYLETVSFWGGAGLDDTHRLMLVGYGQERPVIDGTNSQSSIIRRSYNSPAYITVQRLKLQNTQASGVRLGWDADTDKRDQFFNCVDIWFYACGNLSAEANAFLTSGNCYYLNTDYGFISHCLFERSVGHGVKIGDGSSNCLLEWSVSRENGWWPGRTGFTNGRTVAIDLPSDRDTQTNCTVRYCIASGNVSHGLELRRVRSFNIHHNEIYDFGHGLDMAGAMNGVVPYGVTLIATSFGRFENNLVHSPYPANTNGILVQLATSLTNSQIYLCNNLLYDAAQNASALYLDYANTAATYVYNNTIIQSNATDAITIRAGQTTNELVNNIVVQLGAGSCGRLLYTSQKPRHEYNQYYHPRGTAAQWGETGAGELVGDPRFKILAAGAFVSGFGELQPTSPALGRGVQLGGATAVDANGRSRQSRIDLGAFQYYLARPLNLRPGNP